MLAIFIVVLSGLSVAIAWDDSGFLHWFDDELEERREAKLAFQGAVPNYISGSFVQAGPGRFNMGSMRFGHAFDGFSKINRLHFYSNGTVAYTGVFLQSAFLNRSLEKHEIAPAIMLGETDPPSRLKHGPANALGANDNNDVKAVKVGSSELFLSDTLTVSRQSADFTRFAGNIKPALGNYPGVTWKDHIMPAAHICQQGPLAHGEVDSETGVFTSAVGCMSPVGEVLEGYHIVFSINPSAVDKREVIAKIPLPKGRSPSYMHSMAFTKRSLILIAEPMHMSALAVLRGMPLGEGALWLGNKTLFQVIDRETRQVREYEAPSFLFGHILNAWEEDNDIVIDLTWYTMESFSFFHLFQFKVLRDKVARDTWPNNQIRRFRLHANGSIGETLLLPNEMSTAFELPKINPLLQGMPYCIFYGFQTHAYRYDLDQLSTGAGPFGAAAIGKRNVCTGERAGWYEPNHFPAEVEFIPNPRGNAEDDGVLLGIVFDGNTNSSYFQILDAKTMKQLAKAPLPIKVPFLVHSSFFPDRSTISERVSNILV